MIIERAFIEKFRGFSNLELPLNKPITLIAGQNGSMKTTLLGMLAQPFSMKTNIMSEERTIDGYAFASQLKDKFKFSDKHDIPGEHKWTLYINKKVYNKKEYTCKSELRKDNGKFRFWSTSGRDAGDGFVQCPVIFLSLKRLVPIGEEKKITLTADMLTDSEKAFYIENHNKILISTQKINAVDHIKSSNKSSLGPETDISDSLTISAGQDNIGKIILSVLSMKRLKEKFPKDYNGGMIFIDEIESTLYPASQEKLINFLVESNEKFNIQFFATTHSISVIKYMKLGKYKDRGNILYLRRVGEKILCDINPSLPDIENHLNVMLGRKSNRPKIKVYCEDNIGVSFAKTLLPKNIKDNIEFVNNIHLSWTVYRDLYKGKVPEFMNNIILLDGDVKCAGNWVQYPKNRNIIMLPGDVFPEKLLYDFFFELDDNDEFWDNDLGGYSKQVCFRDFPNALKEKDHIKQWYRSQEKYVKLGKLINYWKKEHPDLVEKFCGDFLKTYNYVASLCGYNIITM